MDKITVLMATIPQREKVLSKVIDSLYQQIDEIRIIFNDYIVIPDWVQKYPKIVPKLNPHDSYWANTVWKLMENLDSGYICVADDDILYPNDYVNKMVEAIEKYNKKAIITCHGINLMIPFKTYVKSRKIYHFTHKCSQDIVVDIGGMGVSVFHVKTFSPNISQFLEKTPRDLGAALLAAKNKIPIISIKKEKNWIIPIINTGISIWKKTDKEFVDVRDKMAENLISIFSEK